MLEKARVFAARDDERLGLPALAGNLGVSVYLLRKAARDGRLAVTYGNRTVFGRPVAQTTLVAGEAYKEAYYGKPKRWTTPPELPPVLPTVPPDYDKQLVQLRRRFGLSQAELAERIGAASKAVVYQWESRKRRPSRVLWGRVIEF